MEIVAQLYNVYQTVKRSEFFTIASKFNDVREYLALKSNLDSLELKVLGHSPNSVQIP
jgi:hypothetical protein